MVTEKYQSLFTPKVTFLTEVCCMFNCERIRAAVSIWTYSNESMNVFALVFYVNIDIKLISNSKLFAYFYTAKNMIGTDKFTTNAYSNCENRFVRFPFILLLFQTAVNLCV